jgi:hypothetical protein
LVVVELHDEKAQALSKIGSNLKPSRSAPNSRDDAEESQGRDRESLGAAISRDEVSCKDAEAVLAAFFIEAMDSKPNV